MRKVRVRQDFALRLSRRSCRNCLNVNHYWHLTLLLCTKLVLRLNQAKLGRVRNSTSNKNVASNSVPLIG